MINYNFSIPLALEFFVYLETNNYSPTTIADYKNDLAVFDGYIRNKFLRFNLLSRKSLFEYKFYLQSEYRRTAKTNESAEGRRLAPSTINRCITVLRSYLRYLIDMEYPTPIVPDMITVIKTVRSHPHVADFEDMVKVIEFPSRFEHDPKVKARNRAILEMLFSTGLRITELTNLNKSDLNYEGKIFVMGKGRKERFVYMTQRAVHYLHEYLQYRQVDNHEALFICYKRGQRITGRYVQERIRTYRKALGLNVKITPHAFRHGFATYLAEQGASPAAIQVLLGHESLETTTRYINISDQFAQETHRKFHPLSF